MTLRFIGTTSERGNCPTLYEIVETGDIVVQGNELTDFRWETRRGYASDRQGDRFKAFMRGIDPVPEPANPWNVNVREKAAQGARFSRVRIVDDPPTDGQRFLMATAAGNVDAGEDIRVLTRAEAVRIALPTHDFWLFDSRTLA
ncbi:hypothetical protein OHB36_15020 [Streptomyces sp. NBC_00320]|uniref:DUF6879 family protein n=1 Tax=unclassified Streptomyces TaxID=2593676 RepID=UPI00224C9423|nr:DUF6879 family protein [Streptomyces sp. NBC_00320]MCX5148069.1 hypothetical protein [Streptomyces sp. NBC_00320]